LFDRNAAIDCGRFGIFWRPVWRKISQGKGAARTYAATPFPTIIAYRLRAEPDRKIFLNNKVYAGTQKVIDRARQVRAG
jgi:hypothetical protein